MSMNDYANRNAALGMLAGGTIGALAGAHYAPNALGKIDVDRALTRSAYTDVVYDRIAKLGDAGKDLFVHRRDNWFNELDSIKKYTECMFPATKYEKGQFGFGNYITERKATVTAKELKDVLKGVNEVDIGTKGTEIAKNYREAIEKLADDITFNKQQMEEFLIKNSRVYENSKRGINEFLETLPKQKGKYAAIIGAIGAVALAGLTYALTPRNTKSSQS